MIPTDDVMTPSVSLENLRTEICRRVNTVTARNGGPQRRWKRMGDASVGASTTARKSEEKAEHVVRVIQGNTLQAGRKRVRADEAN
jgi:hypothetical protein